MPLDWSQVGTRDHDPLLRPRDIFAALPTRPWPYLRQEQGEVLEKWFARRDDPGGLFATRQAKCSIRAALMAMIPCCGRSFPLVPAAEWVCHVHAACPLAGAGSADRRGDRGHVRFPEDRAAAGGGDPGPAWPVAGR